MQMKRLFKLLLAPLIFVTMTVSGANNVQKEIDKTQEKTSVQAASPNKNKVTSAKTLQAKDFVQTKKTSKMPSKPSLRTELKKKNRVTNIKTLQAKDAAQTKEIVKIKEEYKKRFEVNLSNDCAKILIDLGKPPYAPDAQFNVKMKKIGDKIATADLNGDDFYYIYRPYGGFASIASGLLRNKAVDVYYIKTFGHDLDERKRLGAWNNEESNDVANALVGAIERNKSKMDKEDIVELSHNENDKVAKKSEQILTARKAQIK